MPPRPETPPIPARQTWRCPACRGALAADGAQALRCAACGASFPVDDGIALLVADAGGRLREVERAVRENPAWYESSQLAWYDHGPHRHHLARRRRYVEWSLRRWLGAGARAGRLLDLGCGDGANTRWLVDWAERVDACDYNLLRLRRCRALVGEAVRLCLADVFHLPYPDDAFDVIFFNHVLEHIEQDVEALRAVRRVLKPGGLLVLGVPNAGCFSMRLAYRLQPRLVANSDHVQAYTAPVIESRAREAGFQTVETKHLGYGPPHLKLDERLRQYRRVEQVFEGLGRRLAPRQATSLYLLLRKPDAAPPAEETAARFDATLAVIPSDPLRAYRAKGIESWLARYFNPGGAFARAYLLSPKEHWRFRQFGLDTVPTAARDLPRRLRELGVDVVRAYGGYWACETACRNKAPGVPVVVSVHDTNPEELYDAVREADYVFCMSEAVRELVLERFPHPERAWVLPNRFDAAVMRPMRDTEDFADLDAAFPFERRLLCVGRLSRQKNQETLVRALARLGPGYGALFIGGNDPAPLQTLAGECGVAERCRFVPRVSNRELARWYNWCDAMVTPSRWEGFGLVFVEALACGAVVVTSRTAPMTEFIRDGENGLLLEDYENPEALAALVRSVCEDRDLAARLRAAAPGSVARFERAKVDALEIEYYRRILEASGKRAG